MASALRTWIPDIIQSVEPWMSETDLQAGVRWSHEIQRELGETNFGIICTTRENLAAPWLLYEAGALAKTLPEARVCPYLVDLEPSSLPQGPLAQFQAKRASRDETLDLIAAINDSLGDSSLDRERLHRSFGRCWPDLEEKLNSIPERSPEAGERSPQEILEEVLLLSRGLERQMKADLAAVRHDVNVLDRFNIWERVEERFSRIEKALDNIDGYTDLDAIDSKLDDLETKIENLKPEQ